MQMDGERGCFGAPLGDGFAEAATMMAVAKDFSAAFRLVTMSPEYKSRWLECLHRLNTTTAATALTNNLVRIWPTPSTMSSTGEAGTACPRG